MAFSSVDHLINVPTPDSKVYKDECAFSFTCPDDSAGIYICLNTFIGISPSLIKDYSNVTGNKIFLQFKISKTVIEKDESVENEPVQSKKLALGIPGGFQIVPNQYTIEEFWTLVSFETGKSLVIPSPSLLGLSQVSAVSKLTDLGISPKLANAIAEIQFSESAIVTSERAGASAVWQAENLCPVSKFADNLNQLNRGLKIPPTGHKCSQCELTTNLWINLTDGAINCGRKFWDGSGGNNHALQHYNQTHFPLAVKLGTITPNGAEVFSYPEDEMVTDPHLAQHLAHFGIDILRLEKTDQTMVELEIAANERLGEWLTLQESNKKLEPLFGPGVTGIFNLGNTCYMNSALQVLFSIPHFRQYYVNLNAQLIQAAMRKLTSGSSTPYDLPIDNTSLQLAKIGTALCSGAYSYPPPSIENNTKVSKNPGITPRMFRHLIGKTNNEFASSRQQDVHEFLLHLFSLIETDFKSENSSTQPMLDSPLSVLQFTIQDRLECGLSKKVQYRYIKQYILQLNIPISSATNTAEVAAYESRRNEALEKKIKFDEEPVYLKVSLQACLSAWLATETISNFRSPATNPPFQLTHALHSVRMTNFPDFLCVQMLKFQLNENWTPYKLNVAIQLDNDSKDGGNNLIPNWRLDLSALKANHGPQPGESEFVLETSGNKEVQQTTVDFIPDRAIKQNLVGMGFSDNAATRACMETNNVSFESAFEWTIAHLDDDDLNSPLSDKNSTTSCIPPSFEFVEKLQDIGLTQQQAKRALQLCNNNLEQAANLALTEPEKLIEVVTQSSTHTKVATSDESISKLSNGKPVYELVSFISHMGTSTCAGHYVCHVKRSALSTGIPGIVPACEPSPFSGPDEWVIFNDEKVARSEDPPFQHAYLYIFRRTSDISD